MLGSLTSNTTAGDGGGSEGSAGSCHQHDSNLHPAAGPIFSSFPARQLLIHCADLVHRGDLLASDRAVTLLLSAANAGADDATDRLVRQFCRALSLRIAGRPAAAASSAAYFLFNQIAPFLRFAHLTANQAILEAVAGRRRIHILDLDAHHGLQWPPLLQAIATAGGRPPSVRITGAGSDFETLRRTGDRLTAFARSFHLDFDFRPLLLLPKHRPHRPTTLDQLHLDHTETMAVNCVLFLHKLQKEEELLSFLTTLKAINPAVVTVAEREMPPASDVSPNSIHQFAAAVEYYSAMFESLEATLPPSSRERSEVEHSWLGREIQTVVAGREVHRWSERWEIAMRTVGFRNIPPSRFAVSQGKMLLRLHYPAEGYEMEVVKEGFCFLGWKNKPLFSVSSWH
ncbi:protein MONOCULM 1-like [Zingiber officinale]|nr:protein MONOCULM 1-like [Zingiber officinale]